MIELIPAAQQLQRLDKDAHTLGPALIYAYLIDENFFQNLFHTTLQSSQLHVLGDHRQRGTLKKLVTL